MGFEAQHIVLHVLNGCDKHVFGGVCHLSNVMVLKINADCFNSNLCSSELFYYELRDIQCRSELFARHVNILTGS